MRARSFILAVFCMFFLCAPRDVLTQSFFTLQPEPAGGNIHAIAYAADGNPVCMTATRIYRWHGTEQRWEARQSYWRDGNRKTLYRAPDGTLFACAPTAGLYMSKDDGRTWTKVAGIDSYSYGITATQDGTLFHVGRGVQMSTDGAATWTDRSSGIIDDDLKAIVVQSDASLLATSWNDGVYRTTDNGASWQLIVGSPTRVLRLFVTSGGKVWAAGNEHTHFSTDQGETWTPATGTFSGNIGGFCESPAGTLYAASTWAQGGLYRSTDDGDTWMKISSETGSHARNDLASSSTGELSCAHGAGVQTSKDNGDTWPWRNEGLNAASIRGFVENGSGVLFCNVAWSGVHRSSDHGLSWTRVWNTDLPPWIRVLRIDSDDALFAASDEYLYRSSDDGTTWQHLNAQHRFQNCTDVLLIPPQALLTAENGRCSYSSDGGAHWELRSQGLPRSRMTALLRLPDGMILAALSDSGLYRSNNDGLTWEKFGDFPSGIDINDMALRPPATVFATTMRDGVYRSNDGGIHWTRLKRGMQTPYMKALHVSPAAGVYIGSTEGVFFLEEEKDTWIPLEGINHQVNAFITDFRSYLFAGTESDGLYLGRTALTVPLAVLPSLLTPMDGSSETGTAPDFSWSEVQDALYYHLQVAEDASMSSPVIDSVFSARAMLRVGGLADSRQYHWRVRAGNTAGAGGWSAIHSFHTGKISHIATSVAPARSILYQNYPNPVHGRTQIAFTLAESGPAELSVYNILGERIRILAHGHLRSGVHHVGFDASALPEGSYLYRLETARGSLSRTLTVLR
ncbi:MAG: T9SS type A sorting domain-containing protein [Bacteroidetes bacterium]|nr:T9SS type A sorting domain-containing protein [Bacteroidota bacterium]